MLWIREILVRIRIRGSVPLTNGSGSCFILQRLTCSLQKIIFFKVFSFYFLKVHWFFLLFFACWWKDPDPGPFKIMTDSDPQHCFRKSDLVGGCCVYGMYCSYPSDSYPSVCTVYSIVLESRPFFTATYFFFLRRPWPTVAFILQTSQKPYHRITANITKQIF